MPLSSADEHEVLIARQLRLERIAVFSERLQAVRILDTLLDDEASHPSPGLLADESDGLRRAVPHFLKVARDERAGQPLRPDRF